MRNDWYFRYALRFLFKVICNGYGKELLTP
ncbi:DUF3265 domain-containing protein [Vibrio europaeus]|uniref:DUF3265 domain-containing protein n=1 Tax=Vibrio europaeus TaxID=300876 RepID=A0ABT5GPX5_9VIBR|nr:DUF3265 domain-containing protein [Vibrio europaeus]MDC5705350.1 DUF3265 domain-containing protein [Vibrio europaeus]MDC5710629.1 DUF3265 domain-containing protein [Vibrio europaeus]MDC5715719.1 DUF3265 domain-containing protein [Vibrio europaeus]MDC5719880.1 DUF3265 domain-containing protein [Vibrio europaeus]MDC5724232.1 DUF3265 domain-containing protein [Vibrio europaeus]